MNELDIEKISAMLTEAKTHANTFLEAPKMSKYSYKVAAQDLLRKVRILVTAYNNSITSEYRKRKSETPKREKKTENAKPVMAIDNGVPEGSKTVETVVGE